MSRPSILVRAARLGASSKHRVTPKLNGEAAPYSKLMEEEARLNTARCNGDAAYSPTKHVDVLSSLLAAAGYGASPPA